MTTMNIPAGLGNLAESCLNVAALPPFLRVLLTTDGTVTKSLEAYFWESIEVINRKQGYEKLAEDERLLAQPAGASVLLRQVTLQGKSSGTCYAWAESMVCATDLPERVRSGLESERLGIGEILRDCGLETYRKIVDYGEDLAVVGPAAEHTGSTCIWRRYQICMGGKPFILIRECFPLAVFRSDPA